MTDDELREEAQEIDNLKEEFAKEIGDLTQALINIQNLLKTAPQSAWADCVLDICRDALAGGIAPSNEDKKNQMFSLETRQKISEAHKGEKPCGLARIASKRSFSEKTNIMQ